MRVKRSEALTGRRKLALIYPLPSPGEVCAQLGPADLPAEFALVAACAAWPPSQRRDEAIRAAAAGVDWAKVIAVADRHRIAGLVRHSLSSAGITPSPAEAADLNARSHKIATGELFLAGEAARLYAALQGIGIRTQVLKGVAVAMQAFGRLGLRFNHDIDLLVAQPDIPAGVSMLEKAGYVRIEPAAGASKQEVEKWLRTHKDLVFRHANHGSIVELHWRLFDNRYLLPDFASAEAEAVTLPGGMTLQTLPRERALLYMCVHGAEHAWSRLKWLADVGAMLQAGGDGAGERLYELAKTHHVHRAAAQAILLCGRLFGAQVPAQVLADARGDRRIRILEQVALHSMTVGDGAELEDLAFGSTQKNLSHYLLASGWRYWASEVAFDVSDMSRTPVPAGLRVLGPAARPLLWIWRALSGQRVSDRNAPSRRI
jgi:hypothetical protein